MIKLSNRPKPVNAPRNYTVIYTDGNGCRREWYLLASSPAHATMSARELLPASCEITRVYYDPDWND